VGNRESIQYGNGAHGVHIYDELNRLTNLTNYTSLSSFAYTLYANGMRYSVTETLDETRTVTYGYDNLNRLEQETALESTQTYGYTADYTYDTVGNRTYREITIYNSSGVEHLHTKYDYDTATDRLNWEKHRNSQIAMAVPFGNETLYAYADDSGGVFYKTAAGKSIGSFKAYLLGLPSKWGRYSLIIAWSLLAFTLLFPTFGRFVYRRAFLSKKESGACVGHGFRRKPRFSLLTRTICLLLAFVFILGPNEFNNLAQADVLYASLSTSTWATIDRTIEYDYDDNGSLIRKTTWNSEIGSGTKTEEITYTYNLQNRLTKVATDPDPYSSTNTVDYAEYKYNDSGIRVSAYTYQSTDGGTNRTNEKTVLYLIDSANPTGYAQPIVELTFNKANPDPATDTPAAIRSYTIGDDVIAQSDTPGTAAATEYLLYDGQGSTRQVTDATIDGNNDIIDSYSYDAYGMMLGGNPSSTSPAATNLLYTGEQFDTDLQQYYLRARYYNPSNGRFNRMDPYSGNTQDPQSLHKYLYGHANPVNNIDPSGMFTINGMTVVAAIMSTLMTIIKSKIIWAAAAFAATLIGIQYFSRTNILKEPYLGYIRDSSQRNRLKPELVAAIIAAEQSDLNLDDIFFDVASAKRGRSSSIGLGQVIVDTAIEHNLVNSSSRSTVIERLQEPEWNIEATAKYIRIIADMASEKIGPFYGSSAWGPSYSNVDLRTLKLDGNEWDYKNDATVILIGSEYTSKPWDNRIMFDWGLTVLKFYREIESNNVF